MKGITEERLRAFREHCQNQSDLELYDYLLTRCEEINPWQPIESAPKDRRVLVYVPGIGHLATKDGINSYGATHWKELPEDPK